MRPSADIRMLLATRCTSFATLTLPTTSIPARRRRARQISVFLEDSHQKILLVQTSSTPSQHKACHNALKSLHLAPSSTLNVSLSHTMAPKPRPRKLSSATKDAAGPLSRTVAHGAMPPPPLPAPPPPQPQGLLVPEAVALRGCLKVSMPKICAAEHDSK